VGSERAAVGIVRGVAEAEFGAGAFDEWGQRGVVNVADLREQVVLDLKVQPAGVPAEQAIAAAEVDRGAGGASGERREVAREARLERRYISGNPT